MSAHQQAGEHTHLRVVAHGNATLRPIQLMGIDEQVTGVLLSRGGTGLVTIPMS